MNLPESKRHTTSNVITIGPRKTGPNETTVVNLRWDDTCRNGHNSFSVTCDIYERNRDVGGGAAHDHIAKHFPEVRHLLKWHLCSSDGPLHYVANAMYHASDRDCWGLRKGEERQIRNGKTGKPCWRLEPRTKELPPTIDSDEKPEGTETHEYVPWMRVGEGKEPNLEAARNCAIWPEAELEDFTEEKLRERLPGLMWEFKAAIESQGFEY